MLINLFIACSFFFSIYAADQNESEFLELKKNIYESINKSLDRKSKSSLKVNLMKLFILYLSSNQIVANKIDEFFKEIESFFINWQFITDLKEIRGPYKVEYFVALLRNKEILSNFSQYDLHCLFSYIEKLESQL